jgi:dTDP-4-dehydrorhamnose 3,5-epimerase-like enzyme
MRAMVQPRADNAPSGVRVETVKIHRDARGSLFEPLNEAELAAQKNVHVVITGPNEVRGNHRHASAVEMTTVVGPCLTRFKEAGVIRDFEVPAGETWRFVIPPGVAHAYRNTGSGPMVLISFSSEVHDPHATHTIREEIL